MCAFCEGGGSGVGLFKDALSSWHLEREREKLCATCLTCSFRSEPWFELTVRHARAFAVSLSLEFG